MSWAAAVTGGRLKKRATSTSDDLMGMDTESQRTRYSLAEEELVELVQKAVDKKLSNLQIKLEIKNWRSDMNRV